MDKSESKLAPCPECKTNYPLHDLDCATGRARGAAKRSTSADSQEREAELPPLPEPEYLHEDGTDEWGYVAYGKAYTAEQMQDYARAALAAPKPALTEEQIWDLVAQHENPTGLWDGPAFSHEGMLNFVRAVLAAAQGEKK